MSLDQVMAEDAQVSTSTPSSILWVQGLPDDDDDGELEMRLARVGDLVKLEREGETAIATFRNTKAAVDAKERLNGFSLGSGRSITIVFGPHPRTGFAEIDAITGEVIRGNRELHWKIGQLVRSTYSAMRSTNGNYPPPKQSLSSEDFRYLPSLDEPLDMESKWDMSMSIQEKLADYNEFADRRPFHNRYVVLTVRNGSEQTTEELGKFVRSVVGSPNLLEIHNYNNHSIFHVALKSTKDAAVIHSVLNTSITTGEGGLVGLVDIVSVKYGPPINTANSTGKVWVGCSAFLAVDDDKLRDMFALFGEIENFRLVKNKNCLFIAYKSEEAAIRCRNKLFGFEIAPGHFLNVDFAPPAPEYPESSGQKRRLSAGDSSMETPQKRAYEDRPSDRTVRLDLSKMGERMCSVIARKFVIQKSDSENKDFFLPRELDICNRTKADYCKVHLDKLGCESPILPGSCNSSSLGTVILWQFAAATERDCQGYDALCDYFVSKDRVGFYSSKDGSVVTYFVPPVKEFLEPLGLPLDTKYLTALQMPASGQVATGH